MGFPLSMIYYATAGCLPSFSTLHALFIPESQSSNSVYMLRYYSSRPDAQLFEGQEEEQLNRELPDDILRRQLINNLAKHVLFSKNLSTPQPVDLMSPNYSPVAYLGIIIFLVWSKEKT